MLSLGFRVLGVGFRAYGFGFVFFCLGCRARVSSLDAA